MTNFVFRKARREKAKARVAFWGPAKAGKTMNALILAQAIGGRVVVIDSENESASKYADLFEFDVLDVPITVHDPLVYVQAIKAAEDAGYDTIVIDSLSHCWDGEGGALELVDDHVKRAASKIRGANAFNHGWTEVTPIQRRLINAIVTSKCHVICTMRAKMSYEQEKIQTRDGGTKTIIRKIGDAPIQRKNMEYEFDVFIGIDSDRRVVVGDTRCPAMEDLSALKPGPEFYHPFVEWLNEGVAPQKREATAPTPDYIVVEGTDAVRGKRIGDVPETSLKRMVASPRASEELKRQAAAELERRTAVESADAEGATPAAADDAADAAE